MVMMVYAALLQLHAALALALLAESISRKRGVKERVQGRISHDGDTLSAGKGGPLLRDRDHDFRFALRSRCSRSSA